MSDFEFKQNGIVEELTEWFKNERENREPIHQPEATWNSGEHYGTGVTFIGANLEAQCQHCNMTLIFKKV